MISLLSNNEIYLRALEPEDLEILYRWENEEQFWCQGNTLQPYSKFAIKQYIASELSSDIYSSKQLRLMACLKSDDSSIGCIDLFNFNPNSLNAEIGILVDRKLQNNGYSITILSLILSYAQNKLHIHSLVAKILSTNTPSIKAFQKCGFKKIGILKNWINIDGSFVDIQIYQFC